MDLLMLLKALALGVLEGLTEFLPISSTGHLIIAGDLLGFTGPLANTFKIFIQLGAILAVCWLYRDRLIRVMTGLPSDPVARRFAINIAIAFLPAAILGLLFHDSITRFLFSPVTVAIALIVGGVAILLIERLAHSARVNTVDEVSWREALKIGLAQSLALMPGVSRSGATIMGGLVAGLSRRTAAEFSFFLAIPIMFAAGGFALLKNLDILRLADLPIFATGFLAAFGSALASIKFLITYLGNHSFKIFAWYRIVFGLVVLGYYSL
ncbi:MAG: undecaprenyl-diphosphate phosphatase [Gammaproteobacteria bacterium]